MKRPPNCMNPKSDFIFKRLFGEQETNDKHMDRRTLFYLGKLFLESVKLGEGYHHLKKTITINLLDFNYLDIDRFHSTFHIYEDHEPDYMLTDVLEIHMIEFPKFRKLKKDLSDPLHRWLLFLEAKLPDDQLEELMEMDPVIKKTEERLAQLNADDYTRELYEARENSRIEFNSKMHSSWEEGYENGIEQERERGKRETALKLLQIGIAVDQIRLVTGLTEDEIAKLASAGQ